MDKCDTADTEHIFEGRENDWGFNSFALLADINPPEKGFLHNGALHLKVQIEVEHPDNYTYNSKKKTGFVGLKNQGATCYLNSLLQTLYNINFFRKVGNPTVRLRETMTEKVVNATEAYSQSGKGSCFGQTTAHARLRTRGFRTEDLTSDCL